ncbi:MAG TPA: hypothetical protein GX511_00815 [Firmicutes bacterium]|nr:hypothetical protein [Bacillota bacterium]
MMCGRHGFGPGFGFGFGGGCCSGRPGFGPHFHRHFLTKEERIARVKEYLEALRAEAKAVEEYLKELSSNEDE